MSNGKGSKPRPLSVSKEEFEKNWEQVFGKRKNEEEDEEAYQKIVQELSDLSQEAMNEYISNKESEEKKDE